MSLERFEVKRNIIHPLLVISFINFVLIIIMLVMSATIFATPSGVVLNFANFREGPNTSGQQVEITININNILTGDGNFHLSAGRI